MKLARITWNDSFSIDAWKPKDLAVLESSELMECQTVGFVLSRTKDVMTVCHTINAEGSVCGVMQIPRKCIIKIECL
jgi:hypothetical protein